MRATTLLRIATAGGAVALASGGAATVALLRHLDRVSKSDDKESVPRGLIDIAGQTFAVEPYTDLVINRAEASGDALLSVDASRRAWDGDRRERHRRRAEIERLTRRLPDHIRLRAGLPTRALPPYTVVVDGARITNCREHPAVNLRQVGNVLVQNGWFQ